MRLELLQLDPAWEDPEGNYAQARSLLEKDPPVQRGSIIVLPEMFSTGFSMNVEKIKEREPSRTEAFLREIADEYDCAVMGGLVSHHPEVDGQLGRNEALIVAPGGVTLGRYQKIRTFTYTKEADHYAGGAELVTFPWQGWTVCPFICYDLRFPELFRRGAAAGANLFLVIASWPEVRVEHWLTLLRARAIENQACVAGVNRCGFDPQNSYPGRSIVFDEQGRTLAEAGSEVTRVSAELDLDSVTAWRAEFPALRDMEEG